MGYETVGDHYVGILGLKPTHCACKTALTEDLADKKQNVTLTSFDMNSNSKLLLCFV